MSLPVQFDLLIHVLLYGMFIGITLDFVCVIKDNLLNYYVQLAMVIIYWLIQLPLAFIYIYNVNEGIFHLYILIFLIVGAVIYFKFLKHPLHRDLEMLGESLFTVAHFLKKVVNILVISPIMFIYKLVSDIIMLFLRILKLLFYTPLAKLGKSISCKKKVKRRAKKKKTNINTEE